MIIPGEWFLSLHPMTFKEGGIQVIDHEGKGNMEWSDDIEDNISVPNRRASVAVSNGTYRN